MSDAIGTLTHCPACGKRLLVGEHACSGCGHALPAGAKAWAPEEDSSYLAYAGFGRRLNAYSIDMVIVAVAAFALGFGTGFSFAAFGGALLSAYFMAVGVGLVLLWLYYALTESLFQGTPGKLMTGLMVTDLNGRPISFWRATVRFLAMIPSGLILIGYLMPLWTEKRQTLHDKLAGCLVVER